MHIKVNDLPVAIRSALTNAGYHTKDISVEVTESTSLYCSGGTGSRGFAIVVNLDTGESKRLNGSWGGANMFNPTNAVDLDQTLHTIPMNGAVIKGRQGEKVYATVYVSQANIVKALDAPKLELTEVEKGILKVLNGVNASYRKEYIFGYCSKDYFERPLTEAEYTLTVSTLAGKGLVKVNKAGSVSMTTEGKNAIG